MEQDKHNTGKGVLVGNGKGTDDFWESRFLRMEQMLVQFMQAHQQSSDVVPGTLQQAIPLNNTSIMQNAGSSAPVPLTPSYTEVPVIGKPTVGNSVEIREDCESGSYRGQQCVAQVVGSSDVTVGGKSDEVLDEKYVQNSTVEQGQSVVDEASNMISSVSKDGVSLCNHIDCNCYDDRYITMRGVAGNHSVRGPDVRKDISIQYRSHSSPYDMHEDELTVEESHRVNRVLKQKMRQMFSLVKEVGFPVAESGRGSGQQQRQAQTLEWYMNRQLGLADEAEFSGSDYDVAMGRYSLDMQQDDTFDDVYNRGLPQQLPQMQQQVQMQVDDVQQVESDMQVDPVQQAQQIQPLMQVDDVQLTHEQATDLQPLIQSAVHDQLATLIDGLNLGLDDSTESGYQYTEPVVSPSFGVQQQVYQPVVAQPSVRLSGVQQPVQQQFVQPRVAVAEGSGGVGLGGVGGSSSRPTLKPKEVKLERPTTFSGKHSELDNFVFTMRAYLEGVQLGTGPDACRYVTSYFRGDALTWWRTYALSHQNTTVGTNVYDHVDLDILMNELETQFSDVDKLMRIRNRLFNLRQTDRVQYYTTMFRRLQVELGVERLDDNTAIHLYIQGLKDHIRNQVLIQRPSTFEDTVLCAERAGQAFEMAYGNSGGWKPYRGGSNRGGPGRQQFRGNQFGNNRSGNFNGFRNQQRGGGGRYSGPPRFGNNPTQYSSEFGTRGGPMALGNVDQQQQNTPSHVKCYYCNRSGHVKKNCFKWQREQQGSGNRPVGGQNQTNNNLSVQQQLAAILGHVKSQASQSSGNQKGGNSDPKN